MSNRPIKAMLFTDKFAPHPGGTAIIYYNWARHLPHGELCVVTPTVPYRNCKETDRLLSGRVYRVPFVNIPKLRMPLCWLLLFLASPIAVIIQRPQIFHAGQPLETGWIAWFWAALLRKPFILHCFGDDIPLYWNSRWVGPLMRFLARRANRITVISNYSAEKLVGLGIAQDRISLLYPGVDDLDRAQTTPRAESSRGNKRVLLTVGRLITRKGHDRVLEALPRIIEQIPDLEYVIVGGGAEEQRLRELSATIGVSEHVKFVGSVSHESVAAYYQDADVFVHPNRELANGEVEGFGMVFIEANSHGVPVIGGNTGGAPDAIRDEVTGFLVNPDSVEEIADRVIQLMRDDVLRQRMGDAGREWASNFTWGAAVSQLSAISAAAIGRPR